MLVLVFDLEKGRSLEAWCSKTEGHGILLLCSKKVAVCMFTRWADINSKCSGGWAAKSMSLLKDSVRAFPTKAGSEESSL